MKPSILILAAAALALTSCETLNRIPVNVAWTHEIGGKEVVAGYSTQHGAFLTGRALRQK